MKKYIRKILNILGSVLYKKGEGHKERILFTNNISSFSISLQLDYALAQEIKRKGYTVALSFCDGLLEACQNCKYTHLENPNELLSGEWKNKPLSCKRCSIKRASIMESPIQKYMFSEFDVEVKVNKFKNKISRLTDIEIKEISCEGINLYEHAFAGTARFFAKGNPSDEKTYNSILRQYLVAAYRTLVLYKEIYQDFLPTVIVCHHGIYVPQGIVIDLAKKMKIRVVSYNTGYREGTFLFAHGDTYHKILPKEKAPESKLNDRKQDIISNYLLSRRNGTNDWIYYNECSDEKINLKDKYDIKSENKVISIFSNVYWDAQLHFPENIYPDMMSWLRNTVLIMEEIENVHCIVRAHPGEVNGFVPARQRAVEELRKEMQIPKNITLISSTELVDSYQIAEQSDLIIVYATKMAGELSALGKKVIVCGDAWAKGKGFTYDPDSIIEYKKIIKHLLEEGSDLDENKKNLALAYCYDFFYRRSIKLEFAQKDRETNKISIAYPGENVVENNFHSYVGLNIICNGIINGKDFKTIEVN